MVHHAFGDAMVLADAFHGDLAVIMAAEFLKRRQENGVLTARLPFLLRHFLPPFLIRAARLPIQILFSP